MQNSVHKNANLGRSGYAPPRKICNLQLLKLRMLLLASLNGQYFVITRLPCIAQMQLIRVFMLEFQCHEKEVLIIESSLMI